MTLEYFRGLRLESGAFLAGSAQQLGLELGRYFEHDSAFVFRTGTRRRIHEQEIYITSIQMCAAYFCRPIMGIRDLDFCRNLGEVSLLIVKTARKTRAIAVQLTPQTINRLDQLAERSGMSRHRYMIVVLERAVKTSVVVREQLAFSDE